jgi:hypothetical protein
MSVEAGLGCGICGSSEEDRKFHKCPVCFKHFCDDCSVSMSGRGFCSRFCAEYFFFGGEDDL